MRKLIITLAATGAAIVAAAPASAQYYPQPNPYGYGYGYGGGEVSGMEHRIYNVMRSLGGVRPDRRGEIRSEAISLDRQLRSAERYGLSPYEAHAFDVRIVRLEQRQHWASMNGRYGYGQDNGYNGYYGDRDRYERDHRFQRDDGDNDGN